MLNLYKLEIFTYVVEQGSFSAAAERLLMTQSGVSQHIQDLEAALGTQLFRRGRRGVTLTVAGKRLHDYTQRILALVAEAENAVTDVEQLAAGQVQLGATPGVGVYLLPEWIQSFRSRYPRLTVQLQTKTTSEIVTDLRGGGLDLGIIEGELDEEIARVIGLHPLQEIEQLVIVGARHPFWERKSLAVEDLNGQTLIMRQPGSQSRIWLEQMLQAHGIQARIAAEFDNVESIKRSVALGNGLAILPGYAVRDEQAYGALRALSVDGRPFVRTVKLVWDKRHYFSPVARSLLAHLQGCFPALGEVLYV
jgi:DNA-binding transcriptional LysR family regulator